VLSREEAHRALRLSQSLGLYLRELATCRSRGGGISNSLKWFTHLFGRCSFDHFWVTEIPYYEGVSFPGMIDCRGLLQNSRSTFRRVLPGHEVRPSVVGERRPAASYRDAWLSEGLASFSALWYLQALRKEQGVPEVPGSVRGGHPGQSDRSRPDLARLRNASPTAPFGYQAMIYEKGLGISYAADVDARHPDAEGGSPSLE